MILTRTKHLLVLLLTLVSSITLTTIDRSWAMPAKPGGVTLKQPDGSTLRVLLQGDEHFSWRTTEKGDPIIKGDDGYYYYAEYNFVGEAKAIEQRVSINGQLQSAPSYISSQNMAFISQNATIQRSAQATEASSSGLSVMKFPSQGTIRSAIILVEYSDVSFSIDDPNQAFYNQLNQEDYSVSGATGSAKDYFTANSRGSFDGQFDVYGPYTLPNTRAYYGANDSSGADVKPADMIWDAAKLADEAGVDFSIYDFDNDGYIDNIFVYYAGHNEAEGADENSIWPHKWVVPSQPTFDGKKLYVYACTSELRGSTGSTIAGIGTFCHEFSHVFGLADHYDTDGSTNGTSYGLGLYDIMSYGGYNNDGNTPPLHNGLELEMIGWNSPVTIESNQSITIEPIDSGEVYKVLTEVDGEYFLIENHDNSSGWDRYITSDGLFITHVDRSTAYINSWYLNAPNADLSHECFKFVMANNVIFSLLNEKSVPYPSIKGNDEWTSTSSPAALSWSGAELEFNIVNIARVANSSNITFDVIYATTDITIECSSESVYVGDPFTLTSSIDIDDQIDNIEWEVTGENSSLVSYTSQGESLTAEFSDVGSATFTVTYSSKSIGSYSKSIELTAVEFQGAKGIIYDGGSAEQQPISDATIDIYPVTRSTAEIEGLTSVVYSRSSGTPTYSTTSDDAGEYKIALSSGYYEVEISADNYASIFKVLQIEDGIKSINFAMSSYSDLTDDISVEANQRDATIIWNPLEYSSFLVYVKNQDISSESPTQRLVEGNSICNVDSLEPNCEYVVTVSALQGEIYTELYSATFTTLSQQTTIPLIYIESYDGYSAGDVLELKLLNSEDAEQIYWYYDGYALQIDKVTLDAGEHTIKAIVTTSQTTYQISRMIYVK